MKLKIILSLFTAVILMVACSSDDASCTQQTWYQDADNDGFGNANQSLSACAQPNGYVADNSDFNDNDVNSYPNATEICDGIDNDNDGQIDGMSASGCGAGEVCENGTCVSLTTYYADMDNDGYGDATTTTTAGSMAPAGYVTDNADCDDTNANINPGATEVVDSYIDEDCNGTTTLTAYADNDNDGYGDASNPITFECFLPCGNAQQVNNIPSGYVLDNTDCADNDANTYPGAPEITTDGVDNNCNGYTDEVLCTTDADCPNAIPTCTDQGNGIWICL